MKFAELLRKILPGVWFGLLAAIALLTPAAFSVLGRQEAGVLARAVFALEAPASIVLGALLLVLERRSAWSRHLAHSTSQFSAEMMLVLGTLFCTVAGYYALEPQLEAARTGAATTWSFGQLHAASTAFFGFKGLLVLALAWRAAR